MEQQEKFKESYEIMQRWLSQHDLSPKLLRELSALENSLIQDSGNREAREEIHDRFYKDLDFGTGGLRGILGAGTNRINIYTVRRVTQGLADYMNQHFSGEEGKTLSVAIAYDSRIQSTVFAQEAGNVLLANGFKVYIYDELMPTPALSFAVRHYGCCGGIMITASHNPAKYNGYKVYNEEGCQVTLEAAAEILDCIEKVDHFEGINKANEDMECITIPQETIEDYFKAILQNRVGISCKDLEVVYTPLNGAGNRSVRRILDEIEVAKVHIVHDQENPDGNFPTCSYPNPEKEEALHKGLALCEELITPDLLLATDPDCDRLGIAVRHIDPSTEKVLYKLMSGNEVGILLLDFICSNTPMPERPVAIKTIVTSKMAEEVAARYGIEMINVLTGFKYIGEQIGMLERKGEEGRFIFGFEESYGYLAGAYVRDKDAVNAAMLVCEAAAFYKKQGKTLVDRMIELYDIYGYYKNALVEFDFEGAYGMQKMNDIMTQLRANTPEIIIGLRVKEIADYRISQRRVFGSTCAMAAGFRPISLPKADVMEYILEDGSSFIVRPSGTEPKLKIYLSAKGGSQEESKAIIEDMKATVKGWVE